MIPDFNIFALRITKDNSIGQKILKVNRFYYLLKGYNIEKNRITYDTEQSTSASLYDDYIRKSYCAFHINISAVVGANGSGKSSLIEYIIRLMNNFFSLFLVEDGRDNEDQFQYIDGVYGELYFMLNYKPHLLKVTGNRVELSVYNPSITTMDLNGNNISLFVLDPHPVFIGISRNNYEGKKIYYSEYDEPKLYSQDILDHIFYSIVTNYSLYAYNSLDFIDESNYQLDRQNRPRYNTIGLNKECWVDKLFAKDRPPLPPVVLMPSRVKGNIDVNSEFILSNERLISLLLSGRGFEILNGHLEVVGFELTLKYNSFNYKDLKNWVGDICFHQRAYNKFKKKIIECWSEKYYCSFYKSIDSPLYEIALNYLVIETLRVASKNAQYHKYYYNIKFVEKWVKNKHLHVIENMIEAISQDNTMITLGIRQTLCFLTRRQFDTSFISLKDAVTQTTAAMRSMKEDYQQGRPCMFRRREDVLPAPFFNVRIRLREKNGQIVYLDNLSSGEKQQINSISSILYHLSNLNFSPLEFNDKQVICKRVLVILEEIELYYHPALQKEFIKYFLDGLKQIQFSKIEAISVLVITHSPFVLSDIPTGNIIALKDGDIHANPLQSFGANIHDLLKSSFFLEGGSRGLFAEWTIKEITNALNGHDKDINISKNREIALSRDQIHRLIMTIDEPIIQRVLLERFKLIFKSENRQERIIELESELERLKREIE